MKIGLVTPAWPGTNTANGIATTVAYLREGLIEQGNEVTIIPFKIDGDFEETQVVPVLKRPLSRLERLKNTLGRPNVHRNRNAECLVDSSRRAVEEFGVEVIVIEETNGLGKELQQALDIPVVITLHGPWFMHKDLQSKRSEKSDRIREKHEAEALRSCAGITAPSLNVLRATEAEIQLHGVPRLMVPNPIPFPEETAPESGTGKERLLFVGRFDLHKGGDVVLDAFRKLAEKRPNATLTFVGPDRGVRQSDGTFTKIADMLSALPRTTSDRINYLGQLSREEIAKLRTQHDLTIIASRFENLNYTMLEALASGSAIVSTNSGGPGEVLTDGENALLVDPGDPDAMAEACERILADPELAKRLRVGATKLVEAELTPARVGKRMSDFLKDVVQKHSQK